MFFQFDTKIAHLHTTAEFKLLPQVGSFCVIFQFTHRDLEKNTKNAHYLSQQICGQILCVFPIHPLWFGKKHKNCPLSGRGINAFVHGGQFLCDFPAHILLNAPSPKLAAFWVMGKLYKIKLVISWLFRTFPWGGGYYCRGVKIVCTQTRIVNGVIQKPRG